MEEVYFYLCMGASPHELIMQVKINGRCNAFCHLIIFHEGCLSSTHSVCLWTCSSWAPLGRILLFDSAGTYTTLSSHFSEVFLVPQ